MRQLIERRIDIARDKAVGKLSTELAYQQLVDEVDRFEQRNKVKPKDTIKTYYGGRNELD